MARGNAAKEKVIQKIAQAFGEDWAGIQDKKAYVWADDDGEKVLIALSLTCPKAPIEEFQKVSATPEVKEISAEERKNIEELMRSLGL